MKGKSITWLSVLQKEQQEIWADTEQKKPLILPWITPVVHPKIRDLITRLGETKQYEADEWLFSSDKLVDRIAIVTKGVTARGVYRPQSTSTHAISIPGHFAFGNLNFFSGCPALGHYFSLTQCEIVSCDQKILKAILKKDPELLYIFSHQFELCTLSDRLAFAALALTDVSLRIKIFDVAWASYYGTITTLEGYDGYWIKMPVPMTRQTIAGIVSSSIISVDRQLNAWRQNGQMLRINDLLYLRPQLLEEGYQWIYNAENVSGMEVPHNFKSIIN